MEPSDSNIRIPSVLMPSYNRLIATEEGKSLMKRIRVECGVCKATRFYSIQWGITRIAGVVACEGCRQFYQRFKKQPRVEHCDKGSRCFLQEEFPKKCKACGIAQILSRCPVSVSLFNNLLSYLPPDLKKRMPDKPLTPSEVPEQRRGGLGLEVYKVDTWEDVTDREEVQALSLKDDEAEAEDTTTDDIDMEFEEMVVDEPSLGEVPPPEDPPPPAVPPPAVRGVGRPKKNREAPAKALLDPDQRTSERMRRKKKKVQYFNSSTRGRSAHPSAFHGPDGSLIASGRDLCDCLISNCAGCHFPCIKCGSGKCGKECRINRKWYYDKVEVEGSTLSWNNEYVKKM